MLAEKIYAFCDPLVVNAGQAQLALIASIANPAETHVSIPCIAQRRQRSASDPRHARHDKQTRKDSRTQNKRAPSSSSNDEFSWASALLVFFSEDYDDVYAEIPLSAFARKRMRMASINDCTILCYRPEQQQQQDGRIGSDECGANDVYGKGNGSNRTSGVAKPHAASDPLLVEEDQHFDEALSRLIAHSSLRSTVGLAGDRPRSQIEGKGVGDGGHPLPPREGLFVTTTSVTDKELFLYYFEDAIREVMRSKSFRSSNPVARSSFTEERRLRSSSRHSRSRSHGNGEAAVVANHRTGGVALPTSEAALEAVTAAQQARLLERSNFVASLLEERDRRRSAFYEQLRSANEGGGATVEGENERHYRTFEAAKRNVGQSVHGILLEKELQQNALKSRSACRESVYRAETGTSVPPSFCVGSRSHAHVGDVSPMARPPSPSVLSSSACEPLHDEEDWQRQRDDRSALPRKSDQDFMNYGSAEWKGRSVGPSSLTSRDSLRYRAKLLDDIRGAVAAFDALSPDGIPEEGVDLGHATQAFVDRHREDAWRSLVEPSAGGRLGSPKRESPQGVATNMIESDGPQRSGGTAFERYLQKHVDFSSEQQQQQQHQKKKKEEEEEDLGDALERALEAEKKILKGLRATAAAQPHAHRLPQFAMTESSPPMTHANALGAGVNAVPPPPILPAPTIPPAAARAAPPSSGVGVNAPQVQPVAPPQPPAASLPANLSPTTSAVPATSTAASPAAPRSPPGSSPGKQAGAVFGRKPQLPGKPQLAIKVDVSNDEGGSEAASPASPVSPGSLSSPPAIKSPVAQAMNPLAALSKAPPANPLLSVGSSVKAGSMEKKKSEVTDAELSDSGAVKMSSKKSKQDDSSKTCGTGWRAVEDGASGKTYYVHKKTKRTTWKVEDTYEDEKSSPSASAAATPAAPAAKPSGLWVAKVDAGSGKTYYYHKKTKQTTWKRSETDLGPEGSGGEEKEDKEKKAANGGGPDPDEGGDSDDGAGKSKKKKASSKKKKKKADGEDDGDDAAPLPAGWKAVTDAKTGKQYYVHKATKETTWTRPTASDPSK